MVKAPMKLEEKLEEFWRRVDIDGDCLIYTWGKTPAGYGQFWADSKGHYAHRIAYEFTIGDIPSDLHLDHLCRKPACVNPNHLEPVTVQENTLRGIGPTAKNSQKTHCTKGHTYDITNTYWYKGTRHCRECMRARSNEWKAAKRASGLEK